MIQTKHLLALLSCISITALGMESASSEDESLRPDYDSRTPSPEEQCSFITFAPRPTIPILRSSSHSEYESESFEGEDWQQLKSVDILSFDAAKGVYYYHPLLSKGKRGYELLMVNEGDERKTIDLGPLRYFALRKIYDGYREESDAPWEYEDEGKEQRINDLGTIAYDEERKMFLHTKVFDLAALLAKKELEAAQQDSDDEDLELPGGDFPGRKTWPEGEERLNCVDIMSFDPTIRRYYYESLFYNYESEVGRVLSLCDDAPKTINLGPLKYFATRQEYLGRCGNRQYFRYDDATEAREEDELGPIENDFERGGRHTHAKTFVGKVKNQGQE